MELTNGAVAAATTIMGIALPIITSVHQSRSYGRRTRARSEQHTGRHDPARCIRIEVVAGGHKQAGEGKEDDWHELYTADKGGPAGASIVDQEALRIYCRKIRLVRTYMYSWLIAYGTLAAQHIYSYQDAVAEPLTREMRQVFQ